MTEDVHLVTAQVKTASKFGPKKAADDISDEWKSQYNGSLGANDQQAILKKLRKEVELLHGNDKQGMADQEARMEQYKRT